MTETHHVLQFRSETDPREEYILITGKKREQWETLALSGFQLTAAATMAYIAKGRWSFFLEPEEHRYWLRDEREDNLPN
jgi:hypothetical protein